MDSWNRLEKVIETTGLTTNAFATSIGLKRAENLYRIKKGKNSISKELAELITTKYCNISKSWLLTGEGNMYLSSTEEQASETRKIPFYDSILRFTGNILGNILPSPLYHIEVPMLADCDFAAIFPGDSMIPEIPAGSIVTLKEIGLDSILPGEMYFLITEKYSTIKYIRTVKEDAESLKLVPKNTASYDESIINKSCILKLFLVKGVISTKVL